MGDDIRDGRLVRIHASRAQLPAYFVITPPGPQRVATRVFLEWLFPAA